MSHIQVKTKCMACHLHYVVCSWNDRWHEEKNPFCPECGQQASLVLGTETVDKQIYEVVPGTINRLEVEESEE
jgi:peptide subunit release factor 1 (eRF1)